MCKMTKNKFPIVVFVLTTYNIEVNNSCSAALWRPAGADLLKIEVFFVPLQGNDTRKDVCRRWTPENRTKIKAGFLLLRIRPSESVENMMQKSYEICT